MKKFNARLLFASILSIFLTTTGCGVWYPTRTMDEGAATIVLNPTVTAVFPVDTATDVATNTKIVAIFSEKMDPTTITTSTFTLDQGSTPVSGTVEYSGVSAVFTPTSYLANYTAYTATITTGAKDYLGNTLVSEYVWSFTTGGFPDTTAPKVLGVVPSNTTTGVAFNTGLTATFTEAMNPLTITTSTFTLKHGTTSVLGIVTQLGETAAFIPVNNLLASTTYTATITTGAEDLSGNALTNNYVWSFTTGATPDTTKPTVTGVIPLDKASGVSLNAGVLATFSEAMDPSTITTSNFVVFGVIGTVAYDAISHVTGFKPSSALTASTIYTAMITTGVKDLAGNTLANDYIWSFTTSAAPDTTAPTMAYVVPADTVTGVATNAKITATFSEVMKLSTITTTTFTLYNGITPVTGAVTYSGVTAGFKSTASLNPFTTYTATITTGAKDLAGNPLTTNYVWHFTTGAGLDITPPTVTLVNPTDLATGVCINKTISATFSEDMDPLTINSLNFLIAGKTGTVAYDTITNIATFTPSSNFSINTPYTATITTGVKDLAGNAMTSNRVWHFATGTTACTTTSVSLGAAVTFGGVGGAAGTTNQGLLTTINGDMATTGASTTVTGFEDSVGDIYTITPLNDGMVNGEIYTAGPPPGGAGVGGNATTFSIATLALSDATTAFNNLSPALLPGGIDPGAGQLGGLTLAPGIYEAASGSFMITGSDLTLDAGGDANAVFVFQMASTLTVGGPGAPRSVILINGAKAKNVFWQVGSSATINQAGGGTMVGTIISYDATSFSTAGNVAIVTLNGRALSLNASLTMVNTVINVPL